MKNNDTCHRLIPYAFLLAASVLAAFSACRKDDATIDLRAVIADRPSGGSKVFVDDDNYACWQDDDAVIINGDQYSVDVDPGDNRAATISGVTKNESGGYTAAYPAAYVQSCFNKTVTLTMPSTQTFSSDADGQNIVAPMAGYTDDPTPEAPLRFHNVAGVLKINVKNSLSQGLNIYALEIESSNAYIAGTGTVDGVDTPTPSLTISSDKTKNVMLMCNDKLLNAGNSADFYLVVAPFTDPTKFTVHVLATGADNLKYTFHRESKSGITIARNQIGSISVELADDEYIHTGEAGNYFWGQGTQECPFIIACQADLERLRDLVNSPGTGFNYNANTVYYRQIADITLSSFSGAIGNSSHWFSANYDGGNHFVAGLNSCLFEYVGSTSTPACKISNVITNGTINWGNSNIPIGGIVSYIKANTVLDNCTNKTTIKTNYSGTLASELYKYGHGGVCGLIDAKNYTVEIKNCTNEGNITRNKTYCGGICGSSTYGNVTFEGCVNTGTITSTAGGTTSALGGIIGSIMTSNDPNFTTVKSCTNKGGIVATSNDYSVGGIIGLISNASTKAPQISDCSNFGNINGNDAYKCGGIIGNFEKDNLAGGLTLSGTIKNEGTISGKYFCGGIIGYNHSKTAFDATSNVINNAKVQYSGTTSCSTPYLNSATLTGCGGIIGYTEGLTINGSVTNTGDVVQSGANKYQYVGGIVSVCYDGDIVFNNATIKNEGVIVGATNTGGLIGNCGNLTITNSTLSNSGAITGTNNVGGIAGCISFASTISNATNNGNISGTYNVGGIAGVVSTEPSTISNATNTGNISGTYDVAGIVGNGKITEFTNCKNSGTISASSYTTDKGVAGIIAENTKGQTGHLYISQCINTGTIIGNYTNTGQSLYIGGITGYTNIGITMKDCGNEGDIITNGSAWSMAGLCSMIRSSSTITNCYSIGNIQWSTAPRAAGGLITTNAEATLTNCYFNGQFNKTTATTSQYYSELSGKYAGTTTVSYSYANKKIGNNTHATEYFDNDGSFTTYTNTYNNKTTLGEALRAWQADNPTYTSWTSDAIPTLNLTF